MSSNISQSDLIDEGPSVTFLHQTCKDLGLTTKGTAKGLCLLFYGPSGTGESQYW